MNWLYDYIGQQQLRQGKWEKLDDATILNLQKANRRLQELQTPQAVTDPNAQAQKDAKAEYQRQKQIQEERNKELLANQTNVSNSQAEILRKQAEQAGYNTSQAQQKILSFSWAGRSSYAVEKQTEIQNSVNQNLQNIEAMRQLELAQYEAKLAGATEEALAPYEKAISDLAQKSRDFIVQQANAMNQYNLQNAQTMQEKVNNLLQYASQYDAMNAPLTEEEAATAKSYGDLLIDKDGKVNEALAKVIPPKLLSAAIKAGAVAKWAIKPEIKAPTTASDGAWNLYQFNTQTRGREKIGEGKPTPVNIQKIGVDENWNDLMWFRDPKTQSVVPVQVGWSMWSSIDRETAISKYGSSAAVRNFNPWNIQDTWFGGQKVAGERFTRFETPQDWFNALVAKIKNIQAGNSQVYSPDMTITQYISKYAPASDWNNPQEYSWSVAQFLWVSPNTKISQVDPVKLAEAHAMHEDGKSYQMLKDLGVIWWSTQWPDQSKFPQYVNYIEEWKLPVWMKDNTTKANQFKNEALGWYIENKNQEYAWYWLKIANPQAFSSVVTNPAKIKAINIALQNVPAFKDTMDQLIWLVDKYGTEILPSNERKKMQILVKDAQLQAKEIYNLWVLNWPDLSLMEAIISDPTTWSAKINQLWWLWISYKESIQNAKDKILNNAYAQWRSVWLEPIEEPKKDNWKKPAQWPVNPNAPQWEQPTEEEQALINSLYN